MAVWWTGRKTDWEAGCSTQLFSLSVRSLLLPLTKIKLHATGAEVSRTSPRVPTYFSP